MPVVRVPQRSAPPNPSPRRTVKGNHLPSHLPVLQPPIFSQETDFYTEETLDQPESYNYPTTTMIADQHEPTLTHYYSNHMPTTRHNPHHQTLQRAIPTYLSHVYYNR